MTEKFLKKYLTKQNKPDKLNELTPKGVSEKQD